MSGSDTPSSEASVGFGSTEQVRSRTSGPAVRAACAIVREERVCCGYARKVTKRKYPARTAYQRITAGTASGGISLHTAEVTGSSPVAPTTRSV